MTYTEARDITHIIKDYSESKDIGVGSEIWSATGYSSFFPIKKDEFKMYGKRFGGMVMYINIITNDNDGNCHIIMTIGSAIHRRFDQKEIALTKILDTLIRNDSRGIEFIEIK